MGLRNLERLRVIALERGGLLALAALVLYMWMAPAHIVDGDNAEFATLGTLGGTAHPSGYPLYLLWLRAMQWLPGTTPAHTAALATAIIGAASVLVLHAACRAWGARPLAATITVCVFAAAPLAIRSGTRAEVFALNNLVAGAVLWLAAERGPLRGGWRAAALGLVAGLGMSNHMTCTLLAPVGLFGVVRAARETRRRYAVPGIAAAAFVVGLMPYLYLLITPDTALSWGTVRSLDDLYGMVTRRDYGGPGAFLPGDNKVSATTNLVAFAMTLGRTWLWALLAVGLVTLGWRIARPRGEQSRWDWALLALSWLVAGPLLVLRFNIDPAGLGLYVVQRFHVLPALLLAIPIASGLTSLLARVERLQQREGAACAVVATLGFAAAAGLSLPHVARVHTPAMEQYVRNVLHSLPPNAVLFAGQDGEYFGVNYVQWALGERQDVIQLAWQLTPFPWYAQRLMRRGVYAPEGNEPALVRVVDYLVSRGRPVFMEATRGTAAKITRTHPSYPYGPVIRILPRGTQIPPVEAVVAENKAIYEAFKFGYPLPGEDDEFATAMHHRYAATWRVLARKLAEEGKQADAAWALEMARSIGPQPD